MASTKQNDQDSNTLTRGIEGEIVWNTGTLHYNFATSMNGLTFASDPGNESIFTGSASFNSLDNTNLNEVQLRQDYLAAVHALSQVAAIPHFVETLTYSAADIKIGGVQNWPPVAPAAAMHFPGTNPKGMPSSFSGDYESNLLLHTSLPMYSIRPESGGGHIGLMVMLHELGHGLGLGHPHGTGNATTVIAERSAAADDAAYDNERYTVMSYEGGGWNTNFGLPGGHPVTPMALDIAALQNMYGTVNNYEGDNTYSLTDARTAALDTDGSDGAVVIGRAFYAIWDTGGTDTINYTGLNRVVLNLNNASLSLAPDARTEALVDLITASTAFNSLPNEIKNNLVAPEYNAAGNFSTIFDTAGNVQLGGFSIASDKHDANAKIENASGGSGDDIIIGNEISNELSGNRGSDLLLGSAGDDTLEGGEGNDELGGGEGNDVLKGGPGEDVALFTGLCVNYDINQDAITGTITISHRKVGRTNDGVDTLHDIEQARFADGVVDLTGGEFECPPIDFIFLVDLSFSFADDLPNFVASASGIFDAILAMDPNAQFAISSFVDLPVSPYGSRGDYVYQPELALTDSLVAFQAALGDLEIKSGGDRPEAQWAGLWGAANGLGLNLREDSRKIVLIATDAPAHSASDYGLNEGTIRQFLTDNAVTTIDGAVPSGTDVGSMASATDVVEDDPTDRGREGPESAEADTGFVIDPTDVGDTDPDYVGGEVEPLLGEVISEGFENTTVLFAVTSDAIDFYENEFPSHVASGTAPLASSGEDIADSIRLALAKVGGEVTEEGGDGTDDLLTGTLDNDGLFGLGGADTILGRAGDDVVDGGSGDDSLNGGEGDDDIRGGTGLDVIFGGMGDDRIDGGDGSDSIYDFAGTNVIRGGLGDDYVRAGFHDDAVYGGAGEDVLLGGHGDDILYGGTGNDELYGGAGSDIFAFRPAEGIDSIKDFATGDDRVDLRKYSGISSFGNLTVTSDTGGTAIYFNTSRTSGVRLEGFFGTLSAVDFLFAEAAGDDFSADTSTKGKVAVNGAATGNIEKEGDQDWFAIELVAGRTYVINLEGDDTGRGTLDDPYLGGIYDSDGTLISGTSDDDSGEELNSRVTFTPTNGGTHYVSAGAFEGNLGTYRVAVTDITGLPGSSISEPVGGDLPADTTTTGRVAVGSSATGNIGIVGDEDWFAIELVAGRTYVINLEGDDTGRGTLDDPYLGGIYDSDGTLISGTSDDDSGEELNSRVTFTPTNGGTHYVSAGAFEGNLGTYRVAVTDITGLPGSSISEPVGGDLPADTTTTGRVAVGSSATGNIGIVGDEDWFAIELVAGRTYVINLEGDDTGRGTLDDPYLGGIYDSDGTLISGTSDDDSGEELNSRVTFTPTNGGTHYVSAGAFEGNLGTYRVAVTDITGLPGSSISEPVGGDLPADTTTTGRVAVGSSATGNIGIVGDEDWFAIELVAGRTYVINLEGDDTGRGTLDDPYLGGIYDSDGTLISGTSDDDSGEELNSRVTFTPTNGGTHYVSAGAFDVNLGTYRVAVTDITGLPGSSISEPVGGDLPADTTTTGRVAVGSSATGNIGIVGDEDWFAVELVADRTYVFDLEGDDTERGTLDDPYLGGIYDSDGTLISGTDGTLISGTSDDVSVDGLSGRVTFTPTNGGTHYVSAGAFDVNLGTYTLLVEEVL